MREVYHKSSRKNKNERFIDSKERRREGEKEGRKERGGERERGREGENKKQRSKKVKKRGTIIKKILSDNHMLIFSLLN